MDNQVKAAHIQGRYGFLAAVLTAIITGMFSIWSANYINKLIDNIDKLNTEKEVLSNQIIELRQQLDNKESEYSDLQNRYTQSEEKYKALLDKKEIDTKADTEVLQNPEINIQEEKWIDLLDVFYHEGKHITGVNSEGWHKIWDSSRLKDSLGNEHNHGIYVRGYKEDTYALEYILDEEYTGFKGLFTLEYESRNTQIESNLKVYSVNNNNEKNLLYSTPYSLYGGIKPIPSDFSIEGVDHIRIEISSDSGDRGEFLLALVDSCFYK